eukprot:6286504-Pyramimonas_sp.AAC.1
MGATLVPDPLIAGPSKRPRWLKNCPRMRHGSRRPAIRLQIARDLRIPKAPQRPEARSGRVPTSSTSLLSL